ncbi:hypothetical protein PN473_04725 [Dolichospermum circinale CS-545/17]|nr:hypothetical protein [Dolichospermum circinale CS-545/17]
MKLTLSRFLPLVVGSAAAGVLASSSPASGVLASMSPAIAIPAYDVATVDSYNVTKYGLTGSDYLKLSIKRTYGRNLLYGNKQLAEMLAKAEAGTSKIRYAYDGVIDPQSGTVLIQYFENIGGTVQHLTIEYVGPNPDSGALYAYVTPVPFDISGSATINVYPP